MPDPCHCRCGHRLPPAAFAGGMAAWCPACGWPVPPPRGPVLARRVARPAPPPSPVKPPVRPVRVKPLTPTRARAAADRGDRPRPAGPRPQWQPEHVRLLMLAATGVLLLGMIGCGVLLYHLEPFGGAAAPAVPPATPLTGDWVFDRDGMADRLDGLMHVGESFSFHPDGRYVGHALAFETVGTWSLVSTVGQTVTVRVRLTKAPNGPATMDLVATFADPDHLHLDTVEKNPILSLDCKYRRKTPGEPDRSTSLPDLMRDMMPAGPKPTGPHASDPLPGAGGRRPDQLLPGDWAADPPAADGATLHFGTDGNYCVRFNGRDDAGSWSSMDGGPRVARLTLIAADRLRRKPAEWAVQVTVTFADADHLEYATTAQPGVGAVRQRFARQAVAPAPPAAGSGGSPPAAPPAARGGKSPRRLLIGEWEADLSDASPADRDTYTGATLRFAADGTYRTTFWAGESDGRYTAADGGGRTVRLTLADRDPAKRPPPGLGVTTTATFTDDDHLLFEAVVPGHPDASIRCRFRRAGGVGP